MSGSVVTTDESTPMFAKLAMLTSLSYLVIQARAPRRAAFRSRLRSQSLPPARSDNSSSSNDARLVWLTGSRRADPGVR